MTIKWEKLKFFKFEQEIHKAQYIFRLPDGYRVSVVRGPFTYGGDRGLWEMVLLNPKGGLDYAVDEDICGGDVLGYLTEANVIDILAELKRRHKHVRTITHMFNTVILRDEESD